MPTFTSFFTAFLQAGMISSAVILIAVILRMTVMKKVTRSIMLIFWAVVFLKLLLPVQIPSPVSIFNHVPDYGFTADTVASDDAAQAEVNSAQDLTIQTDMQTVPASGTERLLQISSTVWAGGIVIMMGILAALFCLTAGKLNQRKPARYEIIEQFFMAANRPKLPVCTLAGITSPFIWGIFRQTLILPDEFECQAPNVPYILQHELCHIRRHDNLWNLIALLAVCLHWYNPLVWCAYFLLSKDMEISCDESVLRRFGISRKKDYAAMLLQFSANANHRKMKWKEGLTMGIGKPSIKERIKAVIDYRYSKKIMVIASFVLVLSVLFIFGTNAVKQKDLQNALAVQSTDTTATDQPVSVSTTTTTSRVDETEGTSASTTSASQKITAQSLSAVTTKPVNEKLQIKFVLSDGSIKPDWEYLDNTKQLTLWQGGRQLPNDKITWTSGDQKNVSIDANGNIATSHVVVDTTVTATYEGKSVSTKVITRHATGCIPPPFLNVYENGKRINYLNLAFDNNEIDIKPNVAYKIQLEVYGDSSGQVYTSSDPSIVSVNQNGDLTGLKSGEQAVVTVSNESGKHFSVTVKVTA